MAAFDYIEFSNNLDICIGIAGHFWTIEPILCMSIFTNSINQRSNTEKQSPFKIKSSTENEYVNGIKKVPQQNFGAYEDL